ncbi:hypothetical protein BW721_08585 [Jeotgalibaca sp. PTS2502]|uniref:hypothetical protein n=1 Tax=Jeotgalibaca sp. PTS2502 TaxID=1903686 RepID=UPI000973ADA7|nr:hypothetical protein [Jeotgalibaca sp. PTS2502]APZ49711.1 hypothetical protein BW721_08585 [Jeotgalibaca sp. PTS2502]
MIEKKYLDLKGMQDRVDEENHKKASESWEKFNKKMERQKESQKEWNDLIAKAVLSEREENEKKRSIEIEKEKAKAIKEVEDKYERQGLKSEDTKRKEEAYRSLLRNISGMND